MTGKALQHQPGEPSIVNLFPRDPLEQAPRPAPLKNSCPHPAHYSLIFLRIAGILKKFSFLDPFQLVSAHRVSMNLLLQALNLKELLPSAFLHCLKQTVGPSAF